MQINQLRREHRNLKAQVVGRGGKRGKTAGRGTKGQKARAGRKIRPEIRDVIKRIPKLRGRGKHSLKSRHERPAVVALERIEALFKAGEVVTPNLLAERGLVERRFGRIPPVKILGVALVTKAITISGCSLSASAKLRIEEGGGRVDLERRV